MSKHYSVIHWEKLIMEGPNPESTTSLLDLNEHIMCALFRYFFGEEIYFVLRNVCRYVKYFANDYVQLVGTFMLTTVDFADMNNDIKAKILHVFRHNHQFTSISINLL